MRTQNINFGKDCQDLFLVEKRICNVNNGSFGQTPKIILEKLRQYQELMYADPDLWFRVTLMEKFKEASTLAAEFIGANPEQTVLMDSASDSITCILRSLKLNSNDKILIPELSYPMLQKNVAYANREYKAKVVKIPLSRDDIQYADSIVFRYNQMLDEHPDTTLLIIEHISAFPAIIFPVEEIVQLVKKKQLNIRVLVDGSQSTGQISIDLQRLQVDFYVFNFTKWVFCPLTVCMMWFQSKYKDILEPNVIGYYHGDGFIEKFFWQGSRDLCHFCVIKDGIQFYKDIGPERMIEYNSNVAHEGGEAVARIWKTELLIRNRTMEKFFSQVIVPETNFELVEKVQNELLRKKMTFFVVFKFQSKIIARFGAQIFSEIQDFENAASMFLEALTETKLSNLIINKI